MNESTPAFTILTWGCQMNEDDSEQISNLLIGMGYRPAAEEANADIIMLNTCSVRSKPEQKARSKLGELAVLKREKPDLIIGVCGCMAQKEGDALRSRAPHIDLIVGTANIASIPEMIADIRYARRRMTALDLPRSAADEATIPDRVTDRATTGLKSFVPIMYGCDNFCSYCVVPYVRGKERSRPKDEIVGEIRLLADRGVKQVTLIGQNVNSYGRTLHDAAGFDDLLRAVNDIPGIERIRFTTSHPKDLSDDLIGAVAELPKVCEHLHLPIQAGDDVILHEMRRGYTADDYRRLVAKLRHAAPDVTLTTDFLVGFPGETEAQFENTVRLAEELRFDSAFMFAFNPLANTAAAALPDQLPTDVKSGRLRRLIELQNSISKEINDSQVGAEFEVLVEGLSPKDSSRLTGLTRGNKTVNFPGCPELAGATVAIRAVMGHLWGFSGELV